MRACRDARRKHGSNKRWIVTTDSVSVVEGAEGALAAHAEEVLTSIEDPDGSRLRAAEWVFRTITDLDAEGRLVRRPRKLGELVEVAGNREGVLAVVEAFRSPDCSFLTSQPSGELGVDTEIDIGHEALIRRWPRLADDKRDPVTQEPAGWIWREFEDGLRWRALAVQAQAFKNDPSATLSPATTEFFMVLGGRNTIGLGPRATLATVEKRERNMTTLKTCGAPVNKLSRPSIVTLKWNEIELRRSAACADAQSISRGLQVHLCYSASAPWPPSLGFILLSSPRTRKRWQPGTEHLQQKPRQ